MQVSAITLHSTNGYNNLNGIATKAGDYNDTSFNSLTSFTTKKAIQQECTSQLFENINDWQNFCHRQLLDGKLNIIA